MNTELLADVRAYQAIIKAAFDEYDQHVKLTKWEREYSEAHRLIRKYSPATFSRIAGTVFNLTVFEDGSVIP